MAELGLWVCDWCGKRVEFDKNNFDYVLGWKSIGAIYCPSCWEAVVTTVAPVVDAVRKIDKVCKEHRRFTFHVLEEAISELRHRERMAEMTEKEKDEKEAVQA